MATYPKGTEMARSGFQPQSSIASRLEAAPKNDPFLINASLEGQDQGLPPKLNGKGHFPVLFSRFLSSLLEVGLVRPRISQISNLHICPQYRDLPLCVE